MSSTIVRADAVPRTDRADAADLVAAQLAAIVGLLSTLSRGDWRRPTDCAGWTVTDMVAHLVGQFEETARPWVMLRRLRAAARTDPASPRIDAHNRQQVRELGRLAGPQLLAALARFGPRGVRALRRMPAPVRRVRASSLFPGSPLVEDSVGYVFDVLAPRDCWMHRVDLTRAVGRDLVSLPADAEIVGQVIRELGAAWSAGPVVLELTGDAGGTWLLGHGTPAGTIRADAVQCLRVLSGRDPGRPLEFVGDPAAGSALSQARIVF